MSISEKQDIYISHVVGWCVFCGAFMIDTGYSDDMSHEWINPKYGAMVSTIHLIVNGKALCGGSVPGGGLPLKMFRDANCQACLSARLVLSKSDGAATAIPAAPHSD